MAVAHFPAVEPCIGALDNGRKEIKREREKRLVMRMYVCGFELRPLLGKENEVTSSSPSSLPPFPFLAVTS